MSQNFVKFQPAAPPPYVVQENNSLPGGLLVYIGYCLLWLAAALFFAASSGLFFSTESLYSETGFHGLIAGQLIWWAVYGAPATAGIMLTSARSPKALFFLKWSALSGLIISVVFGLWLNISGPETFSALAEPIKNLLPSTSPAIDNTQLLSLISLGFHLILLLFIAINVSWCLYLFRSRKLRPAFNLPEPEEGKNIVSGLRYSIIAVFLTVVAYQGVSGIIGTVSIFYRQLVMDSLAENGNVVSVIFSQLGHYLVLSLVTPIVALFGLGSLKKEYLNCRSALPIVLMVIAIFAGLALARNVFTIIQYLSDIGAVNICFMTIMPLLNLVISIWMLINVLSRRGRAYGRRDGARRY